MFSYQYTDQGIIIAEHIGEPVDGWFQSDTAIDATMFCVENNTLISRSKYTYADIVNNVVGSIIEDYSPPTINGHIFVDITNINPQPQVGWAYDGTTFAVPVLTKDQLNAPIQLQIDTLEQQKIRPLSDIALGNGDIAFGSPPITPGQKLAALEQEMQALRLQLVK